MERAATKATGTKPRPGKGIPLGSAWRGSDLVRVGGQQMRNVRLAAYLLRYFGPAWILHKLGHTLARCVGLSAARERFLATAQERVHRILAEAGYASAEAYANYRQSGAPPFFFAPTDRPRYRVFFDRWDGGGAGPGVAVSALRSGRMTYFSHRQADVGCPPDWHRNPFTNAVAPSDRHWSRIAEAAFGDVKVIWEPNRCAWVYALVRHYWRSGDEDAVELFWRLIENWDAANPPGLGVNWRCSQEIAIRVMAWAMGVYAVRDAEATSPARLQRLATMMWTAGHRMALDLPDALSQRNNHGISAAAGLLTVGLLFPEFPESPGWARCGRAVLERLGRELIYDDGWFAQHSLNYQRLVLHVYLWALRLAKVTGSGCDQDLMVRVGRSARLLWTLQDEATGAVPKYGHFDGALVLPLDNCDYLDFRPVTQAVGFLSDGVRWWPDGPWDESLLWLFGPDAVTSSVAPPARPPVAAADGGFYTLRASNTCVMTRCAAFRHRPSQPDMLHVDVWWRGHNVAVDAGTFSYAEGGAAADALVRTRAHNTMEVDGCDQMERFGRFLWFPWITGQRLRTIADREGSVVFFEGEHDAYRRRGVAVRRAVRRLENEAWLIVDRLVAIRPHEYRLHWLLPDLPYHWDAKRLRVCLFLDGGDYTVHVGAVGGKPAVSLNRASEDGSGWRARYYYSREPALS
ncbi:MAG: alginate lyase family protein, partial [Pseudomonadota bacterium]